MRSTDYDVVVIGSGFGGSVAALRLTEKGYSVGVLEAGRRYTAADFPKTSWDVRRFLWFPKLGMRGIQRLDLLGHVLVLSGAGVGGGSLVYAATLYEPHDAFFDDPQWAGMTDWRDELAPFYDQAKRMLGVVDAEADTPADDVLRAVGRHFGVEDSFQPTPVGVFLSEPGVERPDPFFGGLGPARTGCLRCGSCMTGCRHDAKNSLDRNYLHLAEQAGAVVHPEHQVVDLEEVEGGYRITTERPGAWFRRNRRVFTARQVVFAAGALGTSRLLLELAATGRLSNLSDWAGSTVRTNSEAILGATARGLSTDYSRGVAITSSIHPEPGTHIEAVRYGKGSNVMGLLATVLSGEDVGHPGRDVGGGQDLGQRDGRHRSIGGGDHHCRVAGDEHRCQSRHQSEQRRVGRCHDSHHPGRLGSGDVEEGTRHRVEVPVDLGELVAPTGVPDQGVDRILHLTPGPAPIRVRHLHLANEGLGPVLDHLGHPVEDLAPVVSGAGSPSRLGLAGVTHGHAQVFAGRLGHPGDDLPVGVVGGIRPAGF
jgi:choline dehydrogenase-like flavoprotein